MAQRWFELFQRRLPLLYPQMEANTLDQYCQLFLTKDYANLIRLCGAIEYFTVEILELGDKVARGLGVETIELEHINSSIKNDAELNALDTDLNHLCGSNDSTVTDETNEAELVAALMKLMDSSTAAKEAARLKEVEEEKRAINFDDDDEEEEEEAEEDEHRHKVDQPEVIWPFTPETRTPNSTISLAGRTLQVIVKLANIELTPEKPNYPGGAWHVEGMKNEAIVASGIYYINSTNITESRLSFRQSVGYSDEIIPEQDDSATPFSLYGLERDEDMNQELGSLITKSSRAIAFPNIYQHQVQPFQLADPTLPGKRQILVFFLVDPTIRITSTAHVPPQQRHWLKTATGDQTPTVLAEMNAGTSLIPDLVNLIAEYHSDLGVIDQSEAFRVREELMKERKFFVDQNTRRVYQRPFSFCEH